MTKPRLLDLFCGAGGAARGYQEAGFYVVGVDNKPQPRYAGDEFVLGDALHFMLDVQPMEYDAIHASPPCQRYSAMTKRWGDKWDEHPDMVDATRFAIFELGFDGQPFVIENVMLSPLDSPLMLCGSMFGLGSGDRCLRRHRLFESNCWMFPPACCNHERRALPVYGHAGGSSKRDGIRFASTAEWREAMGIDWMTGSEMAEALPPAYTRYIGTLLLAYLETQR